MITLRSPHIDLVDSYIECMDAMRAIGEKIWEVTVPQRDETKDQFVQRLLRAESQPPAGLVPETFFWVCKGDVVTGRISVRHILNENLKEFGGHIGYEISPKYRRQGIAKEALRLVLATPHVQKIGRVLLTCAPDNIGSVKSILANGGTLEKIIYVKRVERETSLYWIQI